MTPNPALDTIQRWWLLATGGAACLPLLPHLPPWLGIAVAMALLLRGGLVWSRRGPLSRWVLVLAVMAGSLGIFVQYRTLFGQNPGVALLVMLLTLKQLESHQQRDGLAVVLLCYFLILTTFFYSQSIANALGLLAAVAVATAALAALKDSRQTPVRLFRLAGLMLAQATPFLLILFLLFPRVSGPLWGLPRDAFSALTGLSDTMTPGSISQLSQSDAIAFRVKFEGDLPPRDQLYWRGPVLTQFDGRTWRPAPFTAQRRLPYATEGREIAYEVTLEPHNKHWLFAIELPAILAAENVMASDYQLLSRAPITQRLRYSMRSLPEAAAGADERPTVLAQATALPPGGNPRTLALGRGWREKYASGGDGDGAILRAAIAFFIGQGLIYTLEPPLLGEDAVDEFLFDTHRGFCEHFSAAFVFALRAASVPARVVTGYQGGEINPVDGYLTVRQSDAHAWAEVWLRGKGWTRIDPTAASFPRRIELNLAAAVPAGDPLPLMLRADLSWLRQWRFRWDAIANNWNQWVLGYNPQRQREFLSRLGMRSPDWKAMTAALAVTSGAVMLALVLWALSQRRRLDPAQALWLRATRRLARRGLPRRPWEAATDYACRVSAAYPEISAEIHAIADLYSGVRYGSLDGIDTLRALVARFKP